MSAGKAAFTVYGTRTALVLVLSLFAVWGMGQHYYYTMMPQVAGQFHLSGTSKLLTDNLFIIAYFVGALPAALYARRLGYKAAILCGLGCISVGCFTLYPAAALHSNGYYIIATAAMVLGWVFLEVAANPLVANLGPAEGFIWRLNLAQAIYPLGSMAALLVAYWLLGTYLLQAGVTFVFSFLNPYILLGAAVFLIAYRFEDTRFPPVATERKSGGELAALRTLLSDRFILGAMAAQGMGIGVLVFNGMIGGAKLQAAFHPHLPGPLGEALFWATVTFAVGRIAGVALMRTIPPARLLAGFAIGGLLCSLLAATAWTVVAGFAVLANQFFAALLWPTILGLAICDRRGSMQLATALVCMGSAAGGTLAENIVVHLPHFAAKAGMLLPAVCFLAIFGFAHWAMKRQALSSAARAIPVTRHGGRIALG